MGYGLGERPHCVHTIAAQLYPRVHAASSLCLPGIDPQSLLLIANIYTPLSLTSVFWAKRSERAIWSGYRELAAYHNFGQGWAIVYSERGWLFCMSVAHEKPNKIVFKIVLKTLKLRTQ